MRTYKNTKILIIVSVVLLMAFSGCTAQNEKVVKTPNGDVKVSEGSGGASWCKSGTTITTNSGGKQASFVIKGITNYEGKEVCESSVDSDEGSMTIYTSQDSTYYVMVTKDKSGKVINTVDMSQPKK